MYQKKTYSWAIRALNPKSGADKRSIDHANAGIGYYILDVPGSSRNYYVVGYKHFEGPIRHGSEQANEYQVKRLDELDRIRYSK